MQYQPVPRATRATGDIIATVILFVVGFLTGAVALTVGMFSVMATDSCGSGRVCNMDTFSFGLMTIFASIPAAAAIAGIGSIIAGVRGPRSPMWIWPAAGLFVLIAMSVAGVLLEAHAVT